jgi:hypothetical protein
VPTLRVMEPHAVEGRPGFWQTCLAVFVAGWVGGFAAGFLWGFFGTYGSAVQVLRGFGETPGAGSPLDSIVFALVGPVVLRAVVGAVVLPPVLRWATGSEVSRLVAGLALGAGGLVAAAGWYALARSGAIATPGYSFVPTVVGFLVSVAVVRASVGRRRRPEGEPSRLKAFALVAGAPLAVLLIGVFVLSGFARDDRGGGRVDRDAYQAATLKAERIFVRSYRAAAALGSAGFGSGGILDQAQTELRSAAAELEEVRPPEARLDDTNELLAAGLEAFAADLDTVGSDPAAGPALTEIRKALVDLHAEGYRIDPGAWELAG